MTASIGAGSNAEMVSEGSQKGPSMKAGCRTLRPIVFALAMIASTAIASAQIQVIPPTINVTPTSAVVGEELTVSWTAPPGSSASDWIGLYHTSDPNSAYMCVTFTGGAESGTFKCEVPDVPGSYHFRYLVNNSFTSIASSNTVIVEPASGFTLSLSKNVMAGNEEITVDWTAPIGRPGTDWIGLFRHGEVDNHNYDPVRWIFTNGASSGSHVFRMPTEPGEYVFRYLLRDSYVSVSESSIVTVGEFSVQVSPGSILKGGVVAVNFTAPAGQPAFDWIGLYEVGASNSAFLDVHFTGGASVGSFTGPFNYAAGVYEYRYFVDNSFIEVAVSNPITVTNPEGFTVSVSAITAALGDVVTVNWVAPNQRTAKDWIGLYMVGANNRQYLQYVYTGGTMLGSATFRMPDFVGDFEFRYLLNDGYADAAISPVVQVR
jgi:hypothetical protein